MTSYTISNLDLTNATIRVPLGDTGRWTEVDLSKVPANVLAIGLVNGFIGSLNNISRGKDEDNKPLSDDVWASARAKRVDAWMAGDWAQRSGGGERATTALREAYVDERKAATGATSAAIERGMKDAVKSAFGDKEPATFARFMDALALAIAERDGKAKDAEHVGKVRAAIETKYQKLADDAAKARAKVGSKLDLTGIDLAI